MSLSKKITLLFLVSLILMLLIGYRSETINQERSETILKQKYLQDVRKLFTWIAILPPQTLKQKIETLGLEVVDQNSTGELQTRFLQPHTFGTLRIVSGKGGALMLQIEYLGKRLLLWDRRLQEQLQKQWFLRVLMAADITVLVIIFLIILKLIFPLKEIRAKMQAFARGHYDSRVAHESNDEIGEVAHAYNTMAKRLEELINARAQLLRNVGHELRTPISKGYFAVEKMEPSSEKMVIQKAFKELERFSLELLDLERLHATGALEISLFDAETLILESLSLLMIEDESLLSVKIEENFSIEGDKSYLAIALKNLIDNAIKYTTVYPVTLTARSCSITVSNQGKELEKPLSHYLHPFVREEEHQSIKGYGLGLNMVQEIVNRHGFTLLHDYVHERHYFTLHFQ